MKRIFIIIALLCGTAQAEKPSIITALRSHIRDTNTAQFKKSYKKLSAAPEETTKLITLAQKEKDNRLAELSTLGTQTKHKKKIATGIGAGALGVGAAALIVPVSITLSVLSLHRDPNDSLVYHVSNTLVHMVQGADIALKLTTAPCPICHHIYDGNHICYTCHTSERGAAIAACTGLIISLATASGLLFKEAHERIKLGWNYKARLEQQIKNLDEIITYIQNPTIAPAIKEQV